MARFRAVAILLMVLMSFACALEEKPTETPIDPSSSSVEPSENTSTAKPPPNTTTAPYTPPSTMPPSTKPPTTPPTTTTTAAPTTTTTAAPTTTTTAAPSTTTPTPTPRPQPTPPQFKKWSYTDDKTNQTCVIVQLALQINLTYATSDSKTANILYNVPVNATNVTGGSCGNDTQWITVQWGPKSLESEMTLKFMSNATASAFSLTEMHLSINAAGEFSDAQANQTIELYDARDNFTTPLAMSYHCNKLQDIQFTKAKNGQDIIANGTVSHLQLEAFHKQNNDQFAIAKDCEAIDTADIVPIAVGCALAGLVVIVLIVYLVGRRRAQARGYLSM